MQLPTAFRDFLQEIRPTSAQRDDYQRGHTTLRERLLADTALKSIIVAVFIQGSYRRSTAIRPSEGQRSDVDLVVVTNLDSEQITPAAALRRFAPFLRTHYNGKWSTNERSLSIELSYVDLDLVVTSAPAHVDDYRGERGEDSLEDAAPPTHAEATAWKREPLLIPDRQWERWDPTNPLVQLADTRQKNAACNGHFVNVVKAIKWWKRQQDLPKHPRSYPLERLIFACCPDRVGSVAEGLTCTFEAIAALSTSHVPVLDNPGVRGQNVMARVPLEQFQALVEHSRGAARLARRALSSLDDSESATLWRELLGPKFPASGGSGPSGPRGGFSPRDDVSSPQGGRFA